MLQVPEDRIKHTWEVELISLSHRHHHHHHAGGKVVEIETNGGVGGAVSTSLKLLEDAAALHQSHRHRVWHLLHELLRIDMDGQHPMNAQASIQVEKFLSR